MARQAPRMQQQMLLVPQQCMQMPQQGMMMPQQMGLQMPPQMGLQMPQQSMTMPQQGMGMQQMAVPPQSMMMPQQGMVQGMGMQQMAISPQGMTTQMSPQGMQMPQQQQMRMPRDAGTYQQSFSGMMATGIVEVTRNAVAAPIQGASLSVHGSLAGTYTRPVQQAATETFTSYDLTPSGALDAFRILLRNFYSTPKN
jgi:hypothetical protein